jgi:hypothetical protein
MMPCRTCCWQTLAGPGKWHNHHNGLHACEVSASPSQQAKLYSTILAQMTTHPLHRRKTFGNARTGFILDYCSHPISLQPHRLAYKGTRPYSGARNEAWRQKTLNHISYMDAMRSERIEAAQGKPAKTAASAKDSYHGGMSDTFTYIHDKRGETQPMQAPQPD